MPQAQAGRGRLTSLPEHAAGLQASAQGPSIGVRARRRGRRGQATGRLQGGGARYAVGRADGD